MDVPESLLKVLLMGEMGGLWAVGSKEDSRLLVLGNWKDPVERCRVQDTAGELGMAVWGAQLCSESRQDVKEVTHISAL